MQIDKSILDFLKKIKKNNNRDWFLKNKPSYDAALQEYTVFIEEIFKQLSEKDMIDALKKFRIYRDVRFSSDKTPYKTNFGTGFSRSTAKLRGGYYLHIQPGESFVGGGFWAPEPHDVKRIRDEFSFDFDTISKIQRDKTFKKYFGSIQGDGLKSAPRGYDVSLPAIDLIKKKQWIVMRPLTDEELASPKFSSEVVKTFIAMRPFFDYMSAILTTNINGEEI